MGSTLYFLPWSEEIHTFQETAITDSTPTPFKMTTTMHKEMQESEFKGQEKS